jgi:hypothetical protein
MQSNSGFGITSGGLGTSGSCVGGDSISIMPWLKTKAEADGSDVESWLDTYANEITSGYGSREEQEEEDLIKLALDTPLVQYERVAIHQAMKRYELRTINISIGALISDMRAEESENAKSTQAAGSEPSSAPAVEPVSEPPPSPTARKRKTGKCKSGKHKSSPKRKSYKKKTNKKKTKKFEVM